jgi:hypothetical protein
MLSTTAGAHARCRRFAFPGDAPDDAPINADDATL